MMKRASYLLAVLLAGAVAGGAAEPKFPAHWGQPPAIQTRDYGDLPGGYGKGSSTLARWITANLENDRAGKVPAAPKAAGAKPVYQNDFAKAELDSVPGDMLVLDGGFAVKEAGGNRFLELPDSPLDTFGVLFGPTERSGVRVTARIFGTGKGRRYPALAVGLNGVGGYKLEVAPAKKALVLFHGEDVRVSVPYEWTSGVWTKLRLQVRAVSAGEWLVEGKAWPETGPEPAGWQIAFKETEEPKPGRSSIWGSPFSGTPIQFDDLVVTPLK